MKWFLFLIGAESVLVAAALVGILHMSAPDHWATLVVLGKSANWPFQRLTRITLVSALGHVALSALLGVMIITLTNEFPRIVAGYFTQAIGIVMVVTGLYVTINSLRKKNSKSESNGWMSIGKPTGYFAILGAALSPDLSILPILLVAAPLGLVTMVRIMIIFAVSSILTDLLLVFAFTILFSQAVEKLPSKYNDALVGVVVAAVGVYVLIFG